MILTAIGACLGISGYGSVKQATTQQGQTVFVEIGGTLWLMADPGAAQANVESGVDKARHNHPPMNWDIERPTYFVQILEPASTPHGGDHAVPDQNRTILNQANIAKVCAAARAARTSQRQQLSGPAKQNGLCQEVSSIRKRSAIGIADVPAES